jgi:hypothetical protein
VGTVRHDGKRAAAVSARRVVMMLAYDDRQFIVSEIDDATWVEVASIVTAKGEPLAEPLASVLNGMVGGMFGGLPGEQ